MSVYVKCAKVIREMETAKVSFKEAIFQLQNDPQFNKIYALTLRTTLNDRIIEDILEVVSPRLPKASPHLLKVLIYEMFVKGRNLTSENPTVKGLGQLREEVLAKFGRRLAEASQKNTELKNRVYFRVHKDKEKVLKRMEKERAAPEADDLIPDLYSLPYADYSRLSKGTDPCLKNPCLVIQSKSSCFPVEALKQAIGNPKDAILIEGCAAPGNKTLQIFSAFPHLETFSFEMDKKRFQTLKERVQFYQKALKANPEKNHLILSDFFSSKKILRNKLDRIKYAVMDPSCSGSGMLNLHSQDQRAPQAPQGNDLAASVEAAFNQLDEKAQKRIHSLAQFQKKMLGFCLEQFTSLEYMVYSTCSIYRQENEDVVTWVMERYPQAQLVHIFEGTWEKRGINFSGKPELNCLARCVREFPWDGKNDGFFTALFRVRRN